MKTLIIIAGICLGISFIWSLGYMLYKSQAHETGGKLLKIAKIILQIDCIVIFAIIIAGFAKDIGII